MSKLIRQQPERTEVELKTILRWDDDGGLIIQTSFAPDNAPVHVG